MNPAQFDQRILLKKRTIIIDELMQEIEDYVPYNPIWAMVRTTRASEVIENGREQMAKEVRFVIRWSKGLAQFVEDEQASFEIDFANKHYNVKSVINDNEENKTFTIIGEVRV